MLRQNFNLLSLSALILWCVSTHAQEPQQMIQRIVDAEYAAYQKDHSDWIYLQETRQSKHDSVQWVAHTDRGEVRRLLRLDDKLVSNAEQQELIKQFLENSAVRKKQLAEIRHDQEQVFDLLRLLPVAFVWTQTGASEATISFHFEPAPHFHPPTHEAKVLGAMTGDLIADVRQHRVVSVRGHLAHDLTFGDGIFGRLQQGSSFSLEQEQVSPTLWQLKSIHVHFQGSALLFKSIALEEDDDRSQFELQHSEMTLEQAAQAVMEKSNSVQSRRQVSNSAGGVLASNKLETENR